MMEYYKIEELSPNVDRHTFLLKENINLSFEVHSISQLDENEFNNLISEIQSNMVAKIKAITKEYKETNKELNNDN